MLFSPSSIWWQMLQHNIAETSKTIANRRLKRYSTSERLEVHLISEQIVRDLYFQLSSGFTHPSLQEISLDHRTKSHTNKQFSKGKPGLKLYIWHISHSKPAHQNLKEPGRKRICQYTVLEPSLPLMLRGLPGLCIFQLILFNGPFTDPGVSTSTLDTGKGSLKTPHK